MNRIHLFIFLFLLFTTCIRSQQLNFEHVDLKGLPSTETYQVFQDSKGIIWISTDVGICRYDGTTSSTYTVKDGISENVVLKIYEDYKHRIWFTTVSGYVFYYENDRFTQIAACKKLEELTKPFYIISLTVGEKDTLYITSKGTDGLIKIPPDNNYQNVIKFLGSFSEANRFALSSKINSTELIVGGGRKEIDLKDSISTFFFDDTVVSLSLKNVRGYYHNAGLFNIRKSKTGTFYIPCRNKLSIIQKSNHNIEYYYFPSDILNIVVDREDDVWICTSKGGCYLFKEGDFKKKPVCSLTSLSVCCIMLDREGSVWASTLEKGVFQCMNKHVLTIPEVVTDFGATASKLTIALFPKKELTVSTTETLTYRDVCDFLPKNSSLISFSENARSTYYGTSEGLYHVEKGIATAVLSEKKIAIPAKQLLKIHEDTILAFATGSMFVIHNKKVVRSFYHFIRINYGVQLADKKVLIAGRSNEGIFEFKNNAFQPFLNEVRQLKTRINCITEDIHGNLWVATNEKGIYCYDTKKQLHEFNEGNGLISNKVNAFVFDSDGNLWCGSYEGLSKLYTSQGLEKIKIENFDKNHGVVDLEINKMIFFNGKVWCAGKTALFYFTPADMKKNTTPPGLYIESLHVNSKLTPFSDSLFLNHDQNDFRIQYAGISYKKTDNRSFLYKLEGYDKNWNTSTTGDIQYTNIHFGTYTLAVYALNNDGFRSEKPLLMTFVINKPFWFTWWFLLIEVIIVCTIGYLIMRYWKHKIEKREREKAAVSEFQMTALRSQMNPHFIFNAIGSIQHYILNNEVKQSYNYLAKFSMLIRNILNNSRQEYISLSQEINTLRLYIELEQIRFTIPFEFEIEIDQALDMEMDIPTMLIQPYVENSIWHGLMPKESAGKLELILKKTDVGMLVIIRDNGVGRKTPGESKHVSRGMSITEQRINMLTMTNKKKFITTIIDLKDETGGSKGTEVNLIIPFDV